MTWRRPAGDQGSGTVLSLALAGVLVIGVTGTALLSAAVTARHRAQAGADLAALAGADAGLGRRPGNPCQVATWVAAANGADVTGCQAFDDGSVVVTVTVAAGGVPGTAGNVNGAGRATVTARAGPAPP